VTNQDAHWLALTEVVMTKTLSPGTFIAAGIADEPYIWRVAALAPGLIKVFCVAGSNDFVGNTNYITADSTLVSVYTLDAILSVLP